MRNYILSLTILLLAACTGSSEQAPSGFVTLKGADLIQPNGEKLFIQGTNLGNWLNPEGYMFGFRRTNSPWMIDQLLREMVGPDETAAFWKAFKENYITRADIDFIASTGANTIRVPFNYKLFTAEDYMGLPDNTGEGFRLMDLLVDWCRGAGLYLILDMHDCPGGQTGDNIDDSFGYPWLFESPAAQEQFCSIWKSIAAHYRDEPVILGYELMNEPIATYFDAEHFNPLLEPLCKKAVAAIREADPNHIVLLGGAQWNSNFSCFSDTDFDAQLMYTCHRYGGPATGEAIGHYIEFKRKSARPMYMGEIGHNSMEWQADFVKVLKANNIGYTFWPYKKIQDSCFAGYKAPEGWEEVVEFSEAPRGSYSEIREHRPAEALVRSALSGLLENVRFENCVIQNDYIATLQMK